MISCTRLSIRDAVGYDVDLGVEIHRNLRPEETIVLAHELAAFRPLYYEDPGAPESVEAMTYVARHIDLPIATGVYISQVIPGSPADEAGLQAGTQATKTPGLVAGGDLITAVDGQPVRDFGEMISYLLNHKEPGDVVIMTVFRGGEDIQVELTLGKRP